MKRIWNVVAPEHCIGCGLWLVGTRDWPVACDVCSAGWPDLRGPEGSTLFRERCAVPFGATGFRLRTEPVLRAQLDSIKYGGDRFLAARWGRWLGRSHPRPPNFGTSGLALVPVPMHWRKRLQRGYNQAFWIAWGLSRAWGIPVVPRLLERTAYRESLTQLSRADRAATSQRLYVSNRKDGTTAAVLVDDVLTTGSTMLGCGHALERNGIQWVGAVTLALA